MEYVHLVRANVFCTLASFDSIRPERNQLEEGIPEKEIWKIGDVRNSIKCTLSFWKMKIVLHIDKELRKRGKERYGEILSFIYFTLFELTNPEDRIEDECTSFLGPRFLSWTAYRFSSLRSHFMMMHSMRSSCRWASMSVLHTTPCTFALCIVAAFGANRKNEATEGMVLCLQTFCSVSSCIRNAGECCWAATTVVYRLAQAKDGRMETSLRLQCICHSMVTAASTLSFRSHFAQLLLLLCAMRDKSAAAEATPFSQ